MKLTVKDKVYTIKFAIEVTARSGIMKKMVELENMFDQDFDDVTGIEKLSSIPLTVAETLLVGLQKFHSDDFGYDIITNEGKEEQISKVCDLLDDYFDENEDADFMELYGKFNEELQRNAFLKSLFQQEEVEQKKQTKARAKKVEE